MFEALFVTFICSEIWGQFLSFESEVGDLASILKVEKRRSQAIEKVSIYLCLFCHFDRRLSQNNSLSILLSELCIGRSNLHTTNFVVICV